MYQTCTINFVSTESLTSILEAIDVEHQTKNIRGCYFRDFNDYTKHNIFIDEEISGRAQARMLPHEFAHMFCEIVFMFQNKKEEEKYCNSIERTYYIIACKKAKGFMKAVGDGQKKKETLAQIE